MKYLVLLLSMSVAACATRHVPDDPTWFYADCYNKQKQEAMLARAESQLASGDVDGRRRLRTMYWNLQKDCK
jgi:hypothetical protein